MTHKRKDIIPPGLEKLVEFGHYTPGVLVGDTLYCAGQVGRDEGLNVIEGSEAQFTRAFENLKKILNAAGMDFNNVVDMVTYHTDMRNIQLFMQVKDRYFTDLFPAWTAVGVTSLSMPGLEVEIKCIAKFYND